ncbi:MAG: hypothetical protein AAGI72_14450 [Pseudomonadota bacterium]
MRKVYVALVVAAAISTCLDVVIGYTAAIAVPAAFFELLGRELGWFIVNLFTITAPCFFVSLMLLPVLGYTAQAETFKYSIIIAASIVALTIWRLDDVAAFQIDFPDLVPRLAGVGSMLLSGFIIARRYVAS